MRELKQEIERLREALADAKHQLVCLDNLWASDQEDFSHPFKINLTAVLERLDKVTNERTTTDNS